MLKKRFDQHVHSSFSSDGEPGTDVARILEIAIAKGLAGVAVTDHLDPLWPDEVIPSDIDLPAYEAALLEAESIYGDRICFIKGVEAGLIKGEANAICREAVRAFPYDFVIGAIHCSATTPVDFPPFLEGRALRDIIDEYYQLILDCVREYKDYDVLGHINVIDRYTDGFAPEDMYMPYIDEILKILVADGKGLEFNTGNFRFNIGKRGIPTMPVLKRFKELGGEIVTIGSDSHCADKVGACLEDGEEMLLAAGFEYIAVFSNRQPGFVKL